MSFQFRVYDQYPHFKGRIVVCGQLEPNKEHPVELNPCMVKIVAGEHIQTEATVEVYGAANYPIKEGRMFCISFKPGVVEAPKSGDVLDCIEIQGT